MSKKCISNSFGLKRFGIFEGIGFGGENFKLLLVRKVSEYNITLVGLKGDLRNLIVQE